MDTTNLQNGTSGKTMLLDFVDEVQVKSSGYNAEFGGATGGVVSVLTKSGTNRSRARSAPTTRPTISTATLAAVRALQSIQLERRGNGPPEPG